MQQPKIKYYISNIIIDDKTDEFFSVKLTNSTTQKETDWLLEKDLMQFSLQHDLVMQKDKNAKILVYTKKNKQGEFCYTIKAFYQGDQKNLLRDEDYLREVVL